MTKKIIYFLCTGNACRSQMAEGWGKFYLHEWEVRSAGIEAHGVNPKAVLAMKEVGIDITAQQSEIIDEELLHKATLVVTLCDDAKDNCPYIPATVRHEHWGFQDPAQAGGTTEEKWQVFQEVRDAIGEKIKSFSKTE